MGKSDDVVSAGAGGSGAVVGGRAVVRDIRERAEEALRRGERPVEECRLNEQLVSW